MQSKNKKPQAPDERRWVQMIKLMPCGVCGEGGGWSQPSLAHEIHQGQWFTSIPLCWGCHQSEHNGIHGRHLIWDVLKKTEMTVLNETIRTIYAMWEQQGRVG